VQLTVGNVESTISVVETPGAILQTEAPVRGGNITEVQITELPVNSRNPVMLALILPGVSSNRGGFGRTRFP
jgi:hypothetical protein